MDQKLFEFLQEKANKEHHQQKNIEISINNSLEDNISDFKEAYQNIKLDLVKLYMDVKIRNVNHDHSGTGFDDDQLK